MKEENRKLDVNELIKVESLPKIFAQLEIIGNEVDKALDGVEEMQCTEENKVEVKKRKQQITKFKNAMEDKRKEIKNKILEPYNQFNDKYEEDVKNKLINAEEILKDKYEAIENEQREKKEQDIRDFANEHIKANNLQDIITFENIGLNITLSASEKSLKEQAKDFIERVAEDVLIINEQEDSTELMLEYKKQLNLSKAMLDVKERKEALIKLEEEKKKQEELKQQEQQIVENVNETLQEEIITPQEIKEEPVDPILEITFTVKGTKEQIIGVRKYLQENNIEYK